jgi:hypothetical protein
VKKIEESVVRKEKKSTAWHGMAWPGLAWHGTAEYRTEKRVQEA